MVLIHGVYLTLLKEIKLSVFDEIDSGVSGVIADKIGQRLEKLAKKIHSNRTYLSDAINSHYQKSFSQWLNEIRVFESKKRLASSDFDHYSIEGIAKDVGFASISTFNANFKKITGITPSYFRKNRTTPL